MIDFKTMENFLFSASPISEKNSELNKAKAIVDQLRSSIQWLDGEAQKEKDPQKKADLLKEITAAKREMIPLTALITKTECSV